jgi:hypothetical protein
MWTSLLAMGRRQPNLATGAGEGLRRSHLVSYEEFGTRNVYRLDATGLEVLRAWTDSFWQTVLDSYADRVRADSEPAGPELPRDMQEPSHQQQETSRPRKGLPDA